MFKIIISLIIGLLSGLLSALFLKALGYVTSFRDSHHYIIVLLPFLGLLKKHFGMGLPEMIKAEVISPWMALRTFVFSIGTHLFGGSAGREGVGVIMGGAISQIFSDRRWLFVGMSAGFASIFGTPLAGIIFVVELLKIRDRETIFYMVISSFAANLVASQFIDHFYYRVLVDWDIALVFYVIIGIFTSGVMGNLFYFSIKGIKNFERHIFLIASFYIFAVFLFNGFPYLGINTDLLAKTFLNEAEFKTIIPKFLLTVITLGVGFKGGEVTPLFILGSSFSNLISSYFGLKNFALSSALGMVSLFGAVTHTPIAAGVMAYELFGPQVGVLALFVSLGARLFMGSRSVYKTFS